MGIDPPRESFPWSQGSADSMADVPDALNRAVQRYQYQYLKGNDMNTTHTFSVLGAVLALGLLLAGCQPEGPAEKAGKEIDQTMEQIKEVLPGVQPEGPMERAGKHLDEATEQVGEQAASLGNEIKEKTER